MPTPRTTRLVLAALAAGAVTAAVAPPSSAATGAVHVSSGSTVRSTSQAAGQQAAANQLSFSPAVEKATGVGVGPDDYSVGYGGPGCDYLGTALCADPAVPATATWSLNVTDLTGTLAANLATGTGNTVGEITDHYFTFPTPGAGTSGTWKVTITFTDATGTWAASTLIDYGSATAAPPLPSIVTDRATVPAGEPVTFTAYVGRFGPDTRLIVDYGDGTAQEEVAVTSTSMTLHHVFAKPEAEQVVWVATTDGVTRSAWNAWALTVTAVDPKLVVTPAGGNASPVEPLTVTLDAGGSTTVTPGAKITDWRFTCDQLVTPEPVPGRPGKATCTYSKPGTYNVFVLVTDSSGAKAATVPRSIAVGEGVAYLPPNLGQYTVYPDPAKPLTAIADLSRVVVDPHADPAKVVFSFGWGDGTYDRVTKAELPADGHLEHRYAEAGTYNTSFGVDDGLGQNASHQSSTIRVTIAAPPKGPVPVFRAAGADRYDTGVQVSRGRWADAGDPKAPAFLRADSVVLATGGGFADALAGVPFSVYENGALLLTEPDRLTGEVRDEIKRVLPADGKHTVYVLGGTAALSPSVVNALTGMGYHVQRIAGADRYGTALQIAHAMGDPAHTVVARGDDFADALSAGPLASDLFGTAVGGNYVPAAVVLSDGKTLDSGTRSYLHGRFTATSGLSVIAVGGAAATALTTVPGFDGSSDARNSGQLSGGDRYETARKVADLFQQAAPEAPVGVATGMAYPDALTGGAFMASLGGPLLLTDPEAASPAMTGALAARAGSTAGVFVFGGPNAVAPKVFDSVVAAVKGVAAKF